MNKKETNYNRVDPFKALRGENSDKKLNSLTFLSDNKKKKKKSKSMNLKELG